MSDELGVYQPAGAIVLEHLTGPSRGTVTWLSGFDLDVSLHANRFLRVTEAGAAPDDLIARLRWAGNSYQIEAVEGRPLWVNGVRVSAQKLKHRDMIEFGEDGPLSRFRRYREDPPARKLAVDILGDGLVYLRVSRQPAARRVFRVLLGLPRRLVRETTRMFRLGVILAIAALAALAYQQSRLNILLQEQIEIGATRLESFSGALARARKEALTPRDLTALRQEFGHRLSSTAERLTDLERRSQASARVIAESMASVVFIQGAYGFRETSSGRMLRHVVGPDGNPLVSPLGQPLLSLEGDGPVAERQFTGSGFAVGDGGALVTNRHVARPWENDANFESLGQQGLAPVMIKYIAYVPGRQAPGAVELVRASEDADLAVLRRTGGAEPIPGLTLADAPPTPGDEVIVMGYPTGLRAMLAQSGDDFIEELQKTDDLGFWSVAARLAERGYIAPLASRGIVSQTTPATIVYDADTTFGGSGGPVLDINGAVVAVTAAILREYSGSNLGVPVSKVWALLEEAGLR